MKEINIARTLISKRKEKGITQDDLANYIGVSKASVSKWETEQSYPDITFLPQLAAYFNITLDELMGYEPQMTKEDIGKLYLKLSADFATKPYDEVMEHCREIVKKYFSCFQLLFLIGAAYINNSHLAGDTDKTLSVIAEARELLIRVKKESNDAELMQQAIALEAYCSLILGKPDEVVELLEGLNLLTMGAEGLLSSAYQQLGKIKEAKSVMQVGIYQHIVALIGLFSDYLTIIVDEPEKFEESYKRITELMETFEMKGLHPAVILHIYLPAAQGYLTIGDTNKALEALEKYTSLAISSIYPLKLQGDDFFNLIDDWFKKELPTGTALPRDERVIRQSMYDGVASNPAFSVLADNSRFKSLVEKLNANTN